MTRTTLTAATLVAALAACGDDNNFPTNSCADVTGTCVQIDGGDVAGLQTTVNTLSPNTTIVLGKGTFAMTNSLTIRAAGVHLIGQGIDATTLDYGPTAAQVNGVDVQGDDFLVQDLTVQDAPKDGIRVEASDGVVFRRIRATWTNEGRLDQRRLRHLPGQVAERAGGGQLRRERVGRRPLRRPVPAT
jgi:hypothetical protein